MGNTPTPPDVQPAKTQSTFISKLTLLLFLIPAAFLALTLLSIAQFPTAHGPLIHSSLSSLPPESRSWDIYPEDFYEGGDYADLPNGRVRYWLIGPERGKKIVLVHGLSVPALIWKDVAPVLASKGYRVLLYDLYGRGYSDAPQRQYDTSLYTTQLALLMQHVRWEKAHIAAVSMGGGIAAAFAATFPSLTTGKVALVASAGLLESGDISRTSKVMSAPIIQTLTSSPLGRGILQRWANAAIPHSTSNPLHEIVQIQSAQLPGYNHALASSLRDGPIRGLHPYFSKLDHLGFDVLLIWGTDDRTVPYRYASRVQSLVPKAKLITVEGGQHDLTISHPEVVSGSLLRFFNGQ